MTPASQALRLDLLRCPIHREPLEATAAGRLSGVAHGEVYPIVDGIPVLLPDQTERDRLSGTNWQESVGAGGYLDYYNETHDQDKYYRTSLGEAGTELEGFLRERRAEGPSLEIGSGKGVLQGIGGDYVALDYSLTALHRFIDPKYARVCGTAERLPFPDRTFSFLFTFAALEHVPNADLAFAEIDRVLKPGGVAVLSPAWHCVQYNCDGIPYRPYGALTMGQKFTKLSLPIRRRPWAKALATLPKRAARRALWRLAGGPTAFHFKRLRPNYEHYWVADADAASSLDSHEGCLFYHSRGYDIIHPGPSAFRQLLCRHVSVVVRKPGF